MKCKGAEKSILWSNHVICVCSNVTTKHMTERDKAKGEFSNFNNTFPDTAGACWLSVPTDTAGLHDLYGCTL